MFIALEGDTTLVPLNANSKKQGVVSHSTPESEMVALDVALREEGLPALDLWDTVLRRKTDLRVFEDNTSTMQILRKGKSPALRHLSRTHRVNLHWLIERFKDDDQIHLGYCIASQQCADILTKPFNNPDTWRHVCKLIGITPPNENDYGLDKNIRSVPRDKSTMGGCQS